MTSACNARRFFLLGCVEGLPISPTGVGPSVRTTEKPKFGSLQSDIAHPCCDQLTAVKLEYPLTSITWLYRGLRYRPIEVEYFLKLSADKLLVFRWWQAQVQYFLKRIGNKLCLWAALLKFWFQGDLGLENSASCYRQGRQLLLTFLTMVTS